MNSLWMRTRLVALATGFLALLAGLVTVVGPPAAAAPIPPGAVGPFQIRNLHNHRCLDEPWRSGGAPNGTQLQLWDCYGRGQVNQHWYLVFDRRAWEQNLGRRYLVINGYSGRCLDAVWNGPNGLPVVVWDCYYNMQNANQLWHVWNADNASSGPIADLNGRIVDAAWDRIANNGTPIQLWDNYGPRNNQSWYLVYNF
jgi:hypothetical protein